LLDKSFSIKDIIISEFSLIESAIYTEPDDQSSWWYHQFLFTWISQLINRSNSDDSGSKLNENCDQEWMYSILNQQISVVEGLLEVEINSKWAMSSLSMMIENAVILLYTYPLIEDKDSQIKLFIDRRNYLLIRLCEVDPYHTNRYKYLQRRKFTKDT
jgi:hypothetical protein